MSCDTLPPGSSSTEIENKHAGLIRIAKHERCMYKVHEQLREVSEKAYKPVQLAIGPYNDQGEVGGGFMQQHKLRYLEQMLERTKTSEETYINALREISEIASKCYVECINRTSVEFLKMMLLDGCFIIELFRKYKIYSETGDCKVGSCQVDPIFQMKWVLPIIARDLLLFENQLPFFVLSKLFMMISARDKTEHAVDVDGIKDLALDFFSGFLLFKCKVDASSDKSTENIELRERDETPHRPRNSGEHAVDIDGEKDGIKDLAPGFFSGFLPFKCKVDASSDKSTENIEHLLCQVRECERLEIWFRFKNAEFEVEHLLGLVHASISISILDMETPYGSESQAQRNLPEKSKHQHGSKSQEAGVESTEAKEFRKVVNPLLEKTFKRGLERLEQMNLAMATPSVSESQAQRNMPEKSKHPEGSELQEAKIKCILAMEFKDRFAMKLKNHLIEIHRWMKIPHAIDLQEAGIEFNKAKTLSKHLYDGNKNEDGKSKDFETGYYCEWLLKAKVEINKVEKFRRRRVDRIENKDRNIHSATELQEAGIKFRKGEISNLVAIKFNDGLMEMSPLWIHDDTETYLRNLVAYEQYCDRDKNFDYITNYVGFLDDLINSAKDVELLRRSGIIHNYLGDDEATSTMVNKLCQNIVILRSDSIYARTSVHLNEHCSRPWNKQMAKLRHDYFNSPWAFVSFLAAVLFLALAIAQTIFSAIPYFREMF